MLKIKDNVDLKELEKYGLYKTKVSRHYDYTDKNISVEEDRTINTWNYLECTDLDLYNDVLYDLIKAGLVEKVSNNES